MLFRSMLDGCYWMCRSPPCSHPEPKRHTYFLTLPAQRGQRMTIVTISLSADPRVVQYVESEPQSITCPTHHRGISSELAAGFPATPTCPPAGIMAYRPHCGHQRPPHIRRSRTVCGRIWTGASPGLTALSRPRLDSATRGYAVLCAYGVGDSWGNHSTA